MEIEDAVKPPGFIPVSISAIFDSLGGISNEVVGLTLHRSHACVEEKKPVVDFVRLTRAFRVANEMLCIVLLDKILHDRSRLEKPNGLPISEGVRQCRDSAVWVDFEEPWLFLSALSEINVVHLVRKTGKVSVCIDCNWNGSYQT